MNTHLRPSAFRGRAATDALKAIGCFSEPGPRAAYHLSRSATGRDERFKTLDELVDRIHALRQGRAIHVAPAYLPRICAPSGACIEVRVEETRELIGYALLKGPPCDVDAAYLRKALDAACLDVFRLVEEAA